VLLDFSDIADTSRLCRRGWLQGSERVCMMQDRACSQITCHSITISVRCLRDCVTLAVAPSLVRELSQFTAD
jgi:hypothetical protein